MSTPAASPLWLGRSSQPPDPLLLELSSSVELDRRLAAHDIDGSIAHVEELERIGVLHGDQAQALRAALTQVGRAIADGSFAWRVEHEDVHMNVEAAVHEAVGPELAGQLQAGRSRNEEIATDERRWLRDVVAGLDEAAVRLQRTLVRRAAGEVETILPAVTHTQPAQPVSLAHYLLAHVEMLERDRGRLADLARRADRCPAGSGAAVGSGLPLDRQRLAERLGFAAPTANSLDAVGDRDYAVELVAACAIGLNHLSRLAADLVLWSTPAYGFVRLSDGFTTGSSMLPNKRNPDAAELVRARAAVVGGHLTTLLGITRALPLSYHRDLQEDRRPLFESAASYELCLKVCERMMATLTFDREAMRAAASRGHVRAIALAERLLQAGVPFRQAHRRVGELVARAEQRGCQVHELPAEELRAALPELEGLDPVVPTLEEAVALADVVGGTAPNRVREAIADAAARVGLADVEVQA
ncbi:MAG TPA: argininosuccinate lyase [Candidatus Binatia bacterium]|nr:argininosuccinate lyase [Candidatus Binatia bacterium]